MKLYAKLLVFEFTQILKAVRLLMPTSKNNKTGKEDLGLSHNRMNQHLYAKKGRGKGNKKGMGKEEEGAEEEGGGGG